MSLQNPNTPVDDLAASVKALRLDRGLTLKQLGLAGGISPATISRIEHGQISPTFDILLRLSKGLGIGLDALANYARAKRVSGWRALTRAGEGAVIETPHYRLELLCAGAPLKPFLTFHATILARKLGEFSALQSHAGQEQIVMLEGAITLYTADFEPIILAAGDAFAFDSSMGHALISTSEAPAKLLWICDLGAGQERSLEP